eukprot:TRINITY_DN538_c2_g1_i1.p1 TRINITY_DN538_c2_g1~~TRINITY_DN538_c2_g1_i1.p1  ORF type:complete len:1291 (+),score=295.23 TRINITY_DN538_c2_g1_i1:137-3874(+)
MSSGWCSDGVGSCKKGNETGPIDGIMCLNWNYYICAQVENVILQIPLESSSLSDFNGSCFKSNSDCVVNNSTLLSSEQNITYKFSNNIPPGYLVVGLQVYGYFSACHIEDKEPSFVEIDIILDGHVVKYPLWTNCSGHIVPLLSIDLFTNKTIPWLTWYSYTSKHTFQIINNDTTGNYTVSVSELSLVFDIKEVDPNARGKYLIPYCYFGICDNEEVRYNITGNANNLGRFNYECSFLWVNATYRTPAVTITTNNYNEFSCKIPYEETKPSWTPSIVALTLRPITGTNLYIRPIELIFYLPPVITKINPSFGPSSGSTRVKIEGNGFFLSPSLTINVGWTKVKDFISVSNDSIEFYTPPYDFVGNEIEVSVSVQINDETIQSSKIFRYINNSQQPIFPKADPCRICLLEGEHDSSSSGSSGSSSNSMSWCGNDNQIGSCLSDKMGCIDKDWNSIICPESQHIGQNVIQYFPSLNTNKFCESSSCILSSENYDLIQNNNNNNNNNNKPTLINFKHFLKPGYIVQSAKIKVKVAYCWNYVAEYPIYLVVSLDETGDTYFMLNDYLPNNDICNSDGTTFEYFTLDDIMIKGDHVTNPLWLSNYRYYSRDHIIKLSLSSNPKVNISLALIEMQIDYDLIRAEPSIYQEWIYPSTLPLLTDEPTTIFVGGENFMRFNYSCTFTNGNTWKNSSVLKMNNATNTSCELSISSSSSSSSINIQNYNEFMKINFQILPDIHTILFYPSYDIMLFKMPSMVSVEPNSGESSGGYIISLKLIGFVDLPYFYIKWNDDDDHLIRSIERQNGGDNVLFAVPRGTPDSKVCIRIGYYTMFTSECIYFTYSSLPLPVTPPTPTPTPTPTLSPSNNDSNTVEGRILEFVKEYWYLLILGILFIIMILSLLLCFCIRHNNNKKKKKKKKNTTTSGNPEDNEKNTNEYQKLPNLASDEEGLPAGMIKSQIVGKGSFGVVYKGIWKESTVAIKQIDSTLINKKKKKKTISLLKEAEIMEKLSQNEYIVELKGVLLNPPHLYIITEYMARGSLQDIISDKNVMIEEAHVCKFSLDICNGMAYLHEQNVIHRDLKPANLLVSDDWKVKVTDFGVSRILENVLDDRTMTSTGSPMWAAPEVLNPPYRYSNSVDVYSFGICLWQMFTRRLPWKAQNLYQIKDSVTTGVRPAVPEQIPEKIRNVIRLSWNGDPSKRPSFRQLIRFFYEFHPKHPSRKHPWKKNDISDDSSNRFDFPSESEAEIATEFVD